MHVSALIVTLVALLLLDSLDQMEELKEKMTFLVKSMEDMKKLAQQEQQIIDHHLGGNVVSSQERNAQLVIKCTRKEQPTPQF